MPSQAERQNYLWKPHTLDSTNITRFEAEAELYYRGFKNAERKYNRKPLLESMTVIGLVLSLVFNLIWLFGLVVVKFFKWLSK